MRLLLLAVSMSLLVTDCATPYQPSGFSGGFTDSQLDANTFRVAVRGNGYTPRETVGDYLLFRCAELTVERGFDHFVILGSDTDAKTGSFTTPGTYRSTTTGSATVYADGEVRLAPGTTKNGEGRVFPFTAELRALLEAQRAMTDDLQRAKGIIVPCVFHRAGQPISDFRKAWAAACEAAGVPGRLFHDFRRSAVRRFEQAGIPRSVAMKLTGHKTGNVYRRYSIVSSNDLRAAAATLSGATPIGTLSGHTPAATLRAREAWGR